MAHFSLLTDEPGKNLHS